MFHCMYFFNGFPFDIITYCTSLREHWNRNIGDTKQKNPTHEQRQKSFVPSYILFYSYD